MLKDANYMFSFEPSLDRRGFGFVFKHDSYQNAIKVRF
jgi:hypothetical protein